MKEKKHRNKKTINRKTTENCNGLGSDHASDSFGYLYLWIYVQKNVNLASKRLAWEIQKYCTGRQHDGCIRIIGMIEYAC